MNRIVWIWCAVLVAAFSPAKGQIYTLHEPLVVFFSDAPLEDIRAEAKAAQGLVNTADESFSFRVPIKSFRFASELMEEHFNENYLESEKYPYGTFKGKIEGDQNFSKDGDYAVAATGVLGIHGAEKQCTIPVVIHVSGGAVSFESKFMVRLADYRIEIPTLVFQKIAEEVEVSVSSKLVPYVSK